MFGNRGPRRLPRWLRFPVGALCAVVGGFILASAAGLVGGGPPDALAEEHWIGGALGLALLAAGLLLLFGLVARVGDYSERPGTMPTLTRLVLDGFGYVFIITLAIMFGFFAFSPNAGWRSGVSGMIGRIVFGVFTLLLGGASIYSLGRAIFRAVRGEPYDDGSPHLGHDQR